MKTLFLRLAVPDRDFAELAAWFTILDDEPTSALDLKHDYEISGQRIVQRVAEDDQGDLIGFYWATRDRLHQDRLNFHLYVRPEQRKQGVGSLLYEDLLQTATEGLVKKLRVKISEACLESREFTEKRGFVEISHMISMALQLDAFEDWRYDEILDRLKSEGFQFTTMEALGNTEDAQRKLYTLNDSTAITTPGTDGEHPWDSFDDFRARVCQANWYKPAGQMIAIDATTGAWVAMSAITRWEGSDYAYNLFTGVDRMYRGRKLAQAVKILALRYGRDVLQVNSVRTHHTAKNLPMIAIDRKFGYILLSGTYTMEKILAQE